MISRGSLAKERIAVLCGGTSCEREVSLRSGKAVTEALISKGLKPLQVDAIGSFLEKLKSEEVTVVFLAMHGNFGEDGELQSLLDREGICYTGSGAQASRLAFDKTQAYETFKKSGLETPRYQIIKRAAKESRYSNFKYPLMVKPARCGSSLGITLVENPNQIDSALKQAFEFDETVLIEDYVVGREMTVGILGDKALPVVEIIPKRRFYDYAAKYDSTGTLYEAPARLSKSLTSSLQTKALKAHRALRCRDVSRVDFLLPAKSEPVILEVNTIPGMTNRSLLPMASRSAGLEFADLCLEILSLACERKFQRSEVPQ